ncbi:hypothetical protein CY34DRAFT_159868 [Suillus luteus UH-Slu-Lm8-n1]|uniref:Uncharacterized protein n=1 Tax=Suillus luteus UH-Slu-Lm8-n1 TaxID=930992 RepID=A0A0D0B6P7_9AGAM|nr:hypothetical protein CY34DRAFT_159868 [Suillus luteus UH-Slu-Lm8-n1]
MISSCAMAQHCMLPQPICFANMGVRQIDDFAIRKNLVCNVLIASGLRPAHQNHSEACLRGECRMIAFVKIIMGSYRKSHSKSHLPVVVSPYLSASRASWSTPQGMVRQSASLISDSAWKDSEQKRKVIAASRFFCETRHKVNRTINLN